MTAPTTSAPWIGPGPRAGEWLASLGLGVAAATALRTGCFLVGGPPAYLAYPTLCGVAVFAASLCALRATTMESAVVRSTVGGAVALIVTRAIRLYLWPKDVFAALEPFDAAQFSVGFCAAGGILGAFCGLACVPFAHQAAATRESRALDAGRDLVLRPAGLLLVVGAIALALQRGRQPMFPAVALALAASELALIAIVDRRWLAWLRRARAQRIPGWSIIRATRDAPAQVWSGDDAPDELLVRRVGADGPYRGGSHTEVIASLSDAALPRAVATRRTIGRLLILGACGVLLGEMALRAALPPQRAPTEWFDPQNTP